MRQPAITLAAALAALTGCQVDEPLGDVHGVMFGVAAATYSMDEATQETAFAGVERKAERTFELDRIYRQWDNARPGSRELWTIEAGRTPIVSFRTTTLAWSAIAKGDHDAELDEIAAGYVALKVPVFCIFDQVPENSGDTLGTPADYAAAYHHIVGRFRAAGATKVAWIFNLKSTSFPPLADLYYPGDDVIDWIGTSAYNFAVGPGGRWDSFESLVAAFVAWAEPHRKPLIVTEWTSKEDSDDPERKAEWIRAATAYVKATPQIKAMSAFWSVTDGTGFDSSEPALHAFRDMATDPYLNLRKPGAH